MSQSTDEHRAASPQVLSCAVITVSDTRTLETDTGGQLVLELLAIAGHRVRERAILPDEPRQLRDLLYRLAAAGKVDAILLTGGTGLASRDLSYETVRGLISKELPGYGELFRMLSFQEIGSAAMLSRAVGGLLGRVVVLTMPGSPAGVRLALEKVILPELAHLVREARR